MIRKSRYRRLLKVPAKRYWKAKKGRVTGRTARKG